MSADSQFAGVNFTIMIIFINIIITIIIIIIITTHIPIITSRPNPKTQHQQRHLPGPYPHTVAAKHRLNLARTFQTDLFLQSHITNSSWMFYLNILNKNEL
jgi:hypothetical protein